MNAPARTTLSLDYVKPLPDDDSVVMFVRTWSPRNLRGTIICLHGYTDNSSEFTFFAESAVKAGYRVVCPDWPGRGRSRWLPASRYTLALFRSCLASLLRTATAPVSVLASSWATFVAISHLVASDTGVSKAVFNDAILTSGSALDDIAAILSSEVSLRFSTLSELMAHLVKTRQSLKLASPEEQELYARRRLAYIDGEPRLDYDPALGHAMPRMIKNLSLVNVIGKIRIDTLMLYGELSPFRDQDAFSHLVSTNQRISVVQDLPGWHPPMLNDQRQVDLILEFIGRQ